MTRLSHTYWNRNGRYQEMLDEMEKANWNNKYTVESKAVARRYYRYFNDGDMPRGKQFSIYMPLDIIEYRLEKQANEMVLKEYARFKKSLERGKKEMENKIKKIAQTMIDEGLVWISPEWGLEFKPSLALEREIELIAEYFGELDDDSLDKILEEVEKELKF